MADQLGEQSWQVWKMAGYEHVAGFSPQAIANPVGRIVGLDVTRRGEVRQCVAGPPEHFGRLTCPQLAAMPHNRRPNAAVACLLR